MAEARKVLGQSIPSAGVLTTLYTVPGATQAVNSTITVCNQSKTQTAQVRISIAINGAADALSQYLVYDADFQPKETKGFTLGITLAAADVVRVYSDTGTVSFNAFGVELT